MNTAIFLKHPAETDMQVLVPCLSGSDVPGIIMHPMSRQMMNMTALGLFTCISYRQFSRKLIGVVDSVTI